MTTNKAKDLTRAGRSSDRDEIAAPPADESYELTLEDTVPITTGPLELSLEDTAAFHRRGLKGPRTGVDGYNPYDTGPAAPPGGNNGSAADHAPRKRTDLRKLSEWIRLQRRVQDLKNEPGEGGDAEGGKGPEAGKGPSKE